MIAKPPTNLNPGCAICGLQPFAHESHHAEVRAALVALQPSKSPTATTPASAAVFAKVNVFWTSVPSLSPRVFVQVNSATNPIAVNCWVDKLMANPPPNDMGGLVKRY